VTATKGVLGGKVFNFEAVLREHLSYLINSSDVTNCIIFLQDEVCHCWVCL